VMQYEELQAWWRVEAKPKSLVRRVLELSTKLSETYLKSEMASVGQDACDLDRNRSCYVAFSIVLLRKFEIWLFTED
jgi:hypothetical protein